MVLSLYGLLKFMASLPRRILQISGGPLLCRSPLVMLEKISFRSERVERNHFKLI